MTKYNLQSGTADMAEHYLRHSSRRNLAQEVDLDQGFGEGRTNQRRPGALLQYKNRAVAELPGLMSS